jgi:TfoX/Sxy family transcriptional regulator of competence genes
MTGKRAAKKTPTFSKAPPGVVAAFDDAISGLRDVVRKPMFGYPSAFVNGNLFAGVFQDRMMVRLGTADREEALGVVGARTFEPMAGRPMREYVELPAAMLSDHVALRAWAGRAAAYAATLPPKTPRKANG